MEDRHPWTSLIGQRLEDLSAPIPVVDRSIVKANCQQMLEACKKLGVNFRPHIKTHKVKHYHSWLWVSKYYY